MSTADDLDRARVILTLLLAADFPGADVYRQQMKHGQLVRHSTGASVVIDRSVVAPAPHDQICPRARLPVEGFGHGKLCLMLHGEAGFLDDLELLNARHFPDPATIKVVVVG